MFVYILHGAGEAISYNYLNAWCNLKAETFGDSFRLLCVCSQAFILLIWENVFNYFWGWSEVQ